MGSFVVGIGPNFATRPSCLLTGEIAINPIKSMQCSDPALNYIARARLEIASEHGGGNRGREGREGKGKEPREQSLSSPGKVSGCRDPLSL